MSQVMDGIGVSEKIVMKRRRSMLLNESIITLTHQLLGEDGNVFNVGSQIEGTTTLGLQSDGDYLISLNKYNVIQDWSEWECGKRNLLMIQDENVSPGYCLLQILRDDAPLPLVVETDDNTYRDRMGRILLKNTMFNGLQNLVRNGPAHSIQNVPGVRDNDSVPAFPCHLRPVQARHWLNQHREEHWPTYDMIQYCSNTRCFVVGVGKTGSVNEAFEWRISTSFAERYLMFNLNITQIRCYVLMKMILKTFITQRFPNSISSFMCKNVLLHCISYTRSDEWKENTIFTCLSFCLLTLYNCVQNEYCPHFFITQNNLMGCRFYPETKPLLLETLRYVIGSNGRALLEIEFDGFGLYIQSSLNGFLPINEHFIPTIIAGQLLKDTALYINEHFEHILLEIKDLSLILTMQKLLTFMSHHHDADYTNRDRKAYRLITRHLCSTLGSILASLNIYQRDHFTYKKALSFMSLGLDSDVASGKLKLASVFYCIGDIERTELILKNIEECYDLSVVESVCKCYDFKHGAKKERFNRLCYESNEECTLLKHITASCVCFIRCEINCCPLELQHDMFRSTQEDFAYRSEDDKWMDMAVVDSLPYLYFLQYKTYSRLGRQDDKQKALSNIARTIDVEPNLGHRETALNLLGQCMEQENNLESAFKCYARSLQIRGRNNSAKIHICKVLNKLINN
jgi:tetratricopeptide (TPR) repeat protein